jgi:uncharacterized protein (TIGR02001 family)
MKMKVLAAAAAVLVSGSAFAGATGNVGGVSEYSFRGLQQGSSNNPAIQGGLDYAGDSGIYVGTWASNVNWGAGGTELDLYGGYTTKFSDSVGIDIGVIGYLYPEKDEGSIDDPNTVEIYAGLILGPVTLKYFYSPSYFGLKEAGGDDASNSYFLASGAFPISETLSLTGSVGYTLSSDDVWLDGPDGLVGSKAQDDYLDYSLGLSKTLEGGFTASFSVIGTNFKDDDPSIVIGLKKTFDL